MLLKPQRLGLAAAGFAVPLTQIPYRDILDGPANTSAFHDSLLLVPVPD